MSIRRNVIVALIIVALLMLLVLQLTGNPDLREAPDTLALTTDQANQETDTGESAEPIRLTAEVSLSPEKFAQLSDENDRYAQDHPLLQVMLTNVETDRVYDDLRARATSGHSADMMLLNNVWVSEFAAAGYLSYVPDAMPDGKESDDERQLVWNGYRWAIPWHADPYVLVINRSAFEQTGDIPSGAADWLAFAASRPDELRGAGTISVPKDDPTAFVSLVWALGGKWRASGQGTYEIAGLADEELDQLFVGSDLDQEQTTAKPFITAELTREERWRALADGTVPAMIVLLSDWQQAALDKSGYLVNRYDETGGLWLAGSSWAVTAGNTHIEEAIGWIQAMKDRLVSNSAETAQGRIWDVDPGLRQQLAQLGNRLPDLYEGKATPSDWNREPVNGK